MIMALSMQLYAKENTRFETLLAYQNMQMMLPKNGCIPCAHCAISALDQVSKNALTTRRATICGA
jgi:hypothetical protein